MTPVEVRPFEGRRATDAEIAEYHELRCAVARVDYPGLPAPSRGSTAARLTERQLHLGERLMWLGRRNGRLAGVITASLPVDGNDSVAVVQLSVHPELRRSGVATELLHAVTPTLREHGRATVEGRNVTEDGTAWAEALGFRVVHTTLTQVLDLTEGHSWNFPAPVGYRLVRWVGAAPADIVESYARARTAIVDAPQGMAALTAPEWSVDRVRRIEADFREHGFEHRTVVAVDPSSGAVVGLTELERRPLEPTRLIQGDTAVLHSHRGHGLGLAMKAAMLHWVTVDVAGLTEVRTATGAANTHMAGVNHRLGFRTVRRSRVVNRELDGL